MRLTVLMLVGLVGALAVPALAQQPGAFPGPTFVGADDPFVELAATDGGQPFAGPGGPGAAWGPGPGQGRGGRPGRLAERLGLTDEDKQIIKDAVKPLREARQAARRQLLQVLRLAVAGEGQEDKLTQALAEFRTAKDNLDAVQRQVDETLRTGLNLATRPRVEAALLALGILDNGFGVPLIQRRMRQQPPGWGRGGQPFAGPGYGWGQPGQPGFPGGPMGQPGFQGGPMQGGGYGPGSWQMPWGSQQGWGGGWPGMGQPGQPAYPFPQMGYGAGPLPPSPEMWQGGPPMPLPPGEAAFGGEEGPMPWDMTGPAPQDEEFLEYLW